MLIRWKGEEDVDTTWEDYYVIKAKFPTFDLADEVRFKGGRVSGVWL